MGFLGLISYRTSLADKRWVTAATVGGFSELSQGFVCLPACLYICLSLGVGAVNSAINILADEMLVTAMAVGGLSEVRQGTTFLGCAFGVWGFANGWCWCSSLVLSHLGWWLLQLVAPVWLSGGSAR